MEAYDREYYNFTIVDIEKLTNVRIERNKRNGRKQEQHLKLAMRTTLLFLKTLGKCLREGKWLVERRSSEYMTGGVSTQMERKLSVKGRRD